MRAPGRCRVPFAALVAAAVCAFSGQAHADADVFGVGSGVDGAFIANAGTTINTVATVSANIAIGSSVIQITGERAAGTAPQGGALAAGNLVLVLQNQSTTRGTTGDQTAVNLSGAKPAHWELAQIQSVVGTTLNLTAPMISVFDANVTQVIRVPQFTTVTINAGATVSAPAWDGSSGGVVAFLANGAVTLTGNGSVSANAAGFRGGPLQNDGGMIRNGCTELDGIAPNDGKKGEGLDAGIFNIAGTTVAARGNYANAAGGGDCHNAGGGGGGNGGPGGVGGNSWDNDRPVGGLGGAALSFSPLDHAAFGAGGGAGHENNNAGTAGAVGGGIVWARAASLTMATGFIGADGATAGNAQLNQGNTDGAGGGGAGGTVYLRFTGGATCAAAGTIHATGGGGGSVPNNAPYRGPGGGGGGGYVVLQANPITTCTATNLSGVGGHVVGTTNPYGAGPLTTTSNAGPAPSTPPGGLSLLPAPAITSPTAAQIVTAQPPTFTGTVPAGYAGYKVDVYIDGIFRGSTIATALLTWSYTPLAVTAGVHTVTATIEFQLVQGTKSTAVTFTEATPTWASVVGLDARAVDGGVLVTWSTDLELDNLGFRVLRADGPGEPEDTGAWIPSTGASFSSYQWLDAGTTRGVHAWWVEDVDLSGAVTRHGPVVLDLDGNGAPAPSSSGTASASAPSLPGGLDDSRWNDPLDLADVRVVDQDDAGITYEIVPPPFDFTPETDADGVVRNRFRIAGYATTDDPGMPDLPRRVVRVPAPLRSLGALTILADEETPVPGLLPTLAPAPSNAAAAGLAPQTGGRVPSSIALPAIGADNAPVRLADAGAMGDARVLELVVTPLRWDSAHGQILSAARIVAHVSYLAAPAIPLEPPTAAERTQGRILSGPSLKIVAASRTLVRVPTATIVAAGLSPAQVAVYRRGVAVPSSIEGDALVFLAEVESTPWSDASAFWIAPRAGAEPAATLAHAVAAAAPAVSPGLARRALHAEEDHVFDGLAAAGAGADRWYWTELMTGGAQTANVSFSIPGSAPTGAASLAVRLQGEYDDPAATNEHVVAISLNGASLGTATLDSFQRRTLTFAVPAGVLTAGANTVTLANASTAVTRVALDAMDVTWTAAADAAGGDELAVTALADGPLTAGGFGAAPSLAIDETDHALLPVTIARDGSGAFLAAVAARAGHLVRFVDAVAPSPVAVARAPVDVLESPAGADYVVVAASSLAPAARGFADYRASRGLRAATFDIADITDQVGFGDPDPRVVRRFLELASRQWPSPRPRYLLLAGVPTWDPKGRLAPAPSALLLSDRVDTSLLSAPTDLTTAALGTADDLPDLAVGRIPARDAAELAAVLAKTKAYESAPRDGWDRRVTLLADDELSDFDDTASAAAALVPAHTAAEHLSAAILGASDARARLLTAASNGAALTAFVGHGGVQTWGGERFLTSTDAGAFSPSHPSIVVAADCLNAWFDNPSVDSLGAALVRAPSGAAAVWTSSAITRVEGHRDLLLAFEHAIWREPGMRLGDAIQRALGEVAWRPDAHELVSTFELLGDPALKPNVNEAPFARARVVSAGAGTALVSGDHSTDADGDALAFRWSVVAAPAGASFHLDGAESVEARLTVATPGRYRLRLLAADAQVAGPPSEVVVDLAPAQGSSGSRGCDVGSGGDGAAAAAALAAFAAAVARRRRRS